MPFFECSASTLLSSNDDALKQAEVELARIEEMIKIAGSISAACEQLGCKRKRYYKLKERIKHLKNTQETKQNAAAFSVIPLHIQHQALALWRANGVNFNATQAHTTLHKNILGFDFVGFVRGQVAPIFSVQTLRNFINNYRAANPQERALVELGEDKFNSQFAPAMGNQRANIMQRNELWQIDSSPLDAVVRDDEGNESRPHLLSVVDVFSGRCVMLLAERSNALALVRLLWKAINEMGLPQAIKGDNGKDYKSTHFQSALANLGIRYVPTPPYRGDKKAFVERHFRTIQHSIVRELPGYIGHNLASREKIEQRTAKKDRKAKNSWGKAKKTNQEHLLSFEQMALEIERAVTLWNEMAGQRRGGKLSRQQLFDSSSAPIVRIAYADFIAAAGEKVRKKVQKKGICINNRTYVSAQMPFVGTEVDVITNIDDASEIFIYSTAGEFLTNARDVNIAPLSAEEIKAHRKSWQKHTQALRQTIKDTRLSDFARTSVSRELDAMKQQHLALIQATSTERKDEKLEQMRRQSKLFAQVRQMSRDVPQAAASAQCAQTTDEEAHRAMWLEKFKAQREAKKRAQ